VHERPSRCQQRTVLAGLAVLSVLPDRVLNRLRVVGLELQRHHWDAVGSEDDVDRVVAGRVEPDLAQDSQPHGIRGLDDLGEVRVSWRELHHRAELGGGGPNLAAGRPTWA